MTVAITRTDLDATDLRVAAARCKDAAASRRMLALALVLEGRTRTEAARAAGMDRQTLRDWVHRYNELGLAGLANLPNPGAPPRKLTAEQERRWLCGFGRAPTLEQHKVVRWRLVDLRDEVAQRFGVRLHERTMGKLMARLNFSRVSVRPRHPEQDAAAQEAHKKEFAELVAAAIPEHARGKPIELWWQDEARVGQQGSLTYIWADRGSRPRAPRDQRYDWAYIFGAVCPARGVGAAPRACARGFSLVVADSCQAVARDGSRGTVPCRVGT